MVVLTTIINQPYNKGLNQGGSIIYFGDSFSVSMDMVNDFLTIVFSFYGLKKL